ncbi:MAG: division plane positioning ATPase MipZ [Asticcacaulis sp.]
MSLFQKKPKTDPRVIVIGNEKGGAGKSTVAMHVAVGLLHTGRSVAFIDLDLRQRSLARFFENRAKWLAGNDVTAPMPFEPFLAEKPAMLAEAPAEEAVAAFETALAEGLAKADYVIIDTPGGDTPLSRASHAKADLIVTPMNDSFIDFDLLGVVDPVTLDVKKPSIYSETVWNSRKLRAMTDRGSIDWLVLRNRLASTEARNRKRVDDRVEALSRRVGFRIGTGLRDRVIYRELFPFGLTVADLSSQIRPVSVSLSHVAARQELRGLMAALELGEGVRMDEAALASEDMEADTDTDLVMANEE